MAKDNGLFFLTALVVFTFSASCSPKSESRLPASEDDDPETEMILPPGYTSFGPRSPNPSDPFDQGPYGQAIGAFFKGELALANSLPDSGTGFLKINRQRNRAWATFDLVEMIRYMGNKLMADFPDSERLQVADISQQKGGKVGGHNSHQNGLDADIAYLRRNHAEADPFQDDGLYENFVSKGKASANLDVERTWHVLMTVYKTNRLNRIFVDWAIKDAFCTYARQDGLSIDETELLRRMQHVASHHDHFHLRLTCPTRSPKCQDQAPPKAGDGCRN